MSDKIRFQIRIKQGPQEVAVVEGVREFQPSDLDINPMTVSVTVAEIERGLEELTGLRFHIQTTSEPPSPSGWSPINFNLPSLRKIAERHTQKRVEDPISTHMAIVVCKCELGVRYREEKDRIKREGL